MKDYSVHKGNIEEAYDCLEKFLLKNKFVAGPQVKYKPRNGHTDTNHQCLQLTIADLAILPTASTLDYLFPITADKWPKIVQWFGEMKKLPYYDEINQKGLDELKVMIQVFLKKE